jgi:D-alanyl-lipoteichoic acid acyltransferase DltB (MBOAT superfamily)
MPQFADPAKQRPNFHNIGAGLFLFAIGLFKKVAFADIFAVWANAAFDSSEKLTTFTAWVGALSYSLQIYFDFSGYTDMALGAALLFNIKLPINFNSPYKASIIAEFWTRWHITLGRWLRQYLYIPLGGSQSGRAKTLRNLAVVMILGGLWHGASWTFLIWGILHGAGLAVQRLWSFAKISLPAVFAIGLTFLFVTVAWVPFRAATMSDAWRVWGGMSGLNDLGFLPQRLEESLNAWRVLYLKTSGSAYEALPWLVLGLAIVFVAPNSMQMVGFVEGRTHWLAYNSQLLVQPVAVGLVLFVTRVLMLLSHSTEFIYFNF